MTRRDLVAAAIGAAIATVAVASLHGLVGDSAGGARGAATGASKSGPGDAGVFAATEREPASGDDQAWRTANANLAAAVHLYQRRLEENEAEKAKIERELKEAKGKLAAAEGDGAPARDPYDLTRDDWKELAKSGSVRARFPCRFDPDWHIGASTAAALGLSRAEAAAVERAYLDEENRIAGVAQAGCAKVLGNAELARRLGPRVCSKVVTESLGDMKPDLQLVADIRAGNVAMPPADRIDPLASLLLVESGSMQDVQAALAETFGPEDARRLAFAEELGSCSSSWGPPPAKR